MYREHFKTCKFKLAGFFIYLRQPTDYKAKNMKQKLLVLVCLISFVSWGKSTTANPSIGLLMRSYNQGSYILFEFSIKNTGEETLTNIYLSETPSTTVITYQFTTIRSMGNTIIIV